MKNNIHENRCVETEIGVIEYELARKRVKNINMRIGADMRIKVSAARNVPVEYIDGFVRDKAGFIEQALMSQAERLKERSVDLSDGKEILYLGNALTVRIKDGASDFAVRKNNELMLSCISGKTTPEELLDNFYQREARVLMKQSLDRMYKSVCGMGVQYPRIRVRKMKSRWGSCHVNKGVIVMNSELVKKPTACIDYVMLHELCHFIYPNHGNEFKGIMTQLMPDWQERRKILNNLK